MTTYANYGWVVLLPALALWRVVNKRANPKGKAKKNVSVLVMVIAAAAGVGLAYTVLGEWLGALIGWMGSSLENVTHSPEARIGVAVALVVLAVGTAVLDIAFDRNADRPAQYAALFMPTLLLLVIGGSMGKSGGDAVHASYGKLASIVHQIGGQSVKGHK